ncbi:MAG TPA: acetyl-CoA carboxylase biotin carboxylase subunit, partial [Acidobacteriota bacterium]|nr:acetyl-CoA carboxylase biotin carboxylase subunit [Acidobacteriota bacterium]
MIANRGEIAVRVIRTCRDMGLKTVAVFSEADRESLHVRLADEAYCIGPAPSLESYLNVERVIDAAIRSGADAIHPGYGFLAENAAFARACSEAQITFVGPPPDIIEMMGSKLASRKAAQHAGVPIVPGSTIPAKPDKSALQEAERLGYPLLVKASAGGGGKGMRVVGSAPDLSAALEAAQNEAQSSFGDATVYLEGFISRPRHIEIQILVGADGEAIHLGERECSIQRRYQKLVEESPSPAVDASLRARMAEAALELCRAVGYRNAGTIEFLVDEGGNFYFLEMNTRLQVEHPVTELVTGIDIVREQILIASGAKTSVRQSDVQTNGHALECRIYAEDPYQGFLPSPGTISTLFEPSGPGVRNDSGVYQGATIPVHYDPLISKLCAWGSSRTEAIARMRRALREYQIGGVRTSIPFFDQLL